ncbi:sporulation protein [Halalkalibacterium ligniniphilum]|uniref:sporulation protein n=1 Tax=Halalkalibacterium ligniniphilum TaxID=1134413 RepID=UPI000344F3C0|nr:sporulation protein [Halalkalibacterium ligniniphilum]
MLLKYLRFLKIGSANVDLVLDRKECVAGEKISGFFNLQGGWGTQTIKRLECDLVAKRTGEKEEKIIETVTTLLMTKTLDSGARAEIPFVYQLPKKLEPSSNGISYRFQTRLVFSDDVKDMDHDEIKIFA